MQEDPVSAHIKRLLASADSGEFNIVDVWPDTLTSILVVTGVPKSQRSSFEEIYPAPSGVTVVTVREFVQAGHRREEGDASFMSGLLFDARDQALALGQPLAIRLYVGQSWAILTPSGHGGSQGCHLTLYPRPGELERIANLAEFAFSHFQTVQTALAPSSWLMIRTEAAS